MANRFRSAYEILAASEHYKSVDWRLKIISWSVATISAISTAYANGFSHRSHLGFWWSLILAALTLIIVEFSLYTLEEGLRSTFKGGTQRALAWSGKWAIKITMVANAAYLCCVIAGITPPAQLLYWNRWSFAVHFAIGLVLIPMIRDADPVIAARMLELRAQTAQEDQIISRLAFTLASPFAMFGARLRGLLDGISLGFRLAFNRQGFSPKNYISNLNSLHRSKYRHIEGQQHKEAEYQFPTTLPTTTHPPRRRNP
jgi:hypothetical protein